MKRHLRFLFQLSILFLLSGILGCGNKTTTAPAESSSAPAASQESAPATAESPAASAEVKTTVGTFVGIEEGDYFHFNMKDESGAEMSFFIFDADISAFEAPGMEGKKIEAKWKTVTRDIPESGGEMELDELVSAKVLN